jgi:hypothetical protein
MLFYLFLACNKAPSETSAPEQAEAASAEAAPEEAAPAESDSSDFQDFGAPFTVEELLPASQLLGTPTDYVGKTVRVEGKVSDVCQKKGCWLVISDADKHMRITTKDHAFFVNKQGAGSNCEIEGEVISREVDPDRTAHFESESAEGAPIPEKEAIDNTVYEIVASSIRFYKEAAPAEAEAAPAEAEAAPAEAEAAPAEAAPAEAAPAE